MDVFYIIVLSIAIILLIVVLTFIGIKMKDSAGNAAPYPPSSLPCPDYWVQTTDASGNNICYIPPYVPAGGSVMPSNTGKIYDNKGRNTLTSSAKPIPGYNIYDNTINFNDPGWNTAGMSSTCAQKSWANNNSLQWDGISNFNNC
jgi:hypothetical protein